MKANPVVLACFVLVGASSYADSWALKPEVKDSEYLFGDTRIVLHYDSTQDQQYPKHNLKIYLKSELVSEHPDVGFEQVFSSPDNAFFAGLSNSGLVEPAYVIFDRNGRILKKQRHKLGEVRYFSMSVSLIRRWYDQDKPDVRFTVVDGKLENVHVIACDGTPISLLIKEEPRLRVTPNPTKRSTGSDASVVVSMEAPVGSSRPSHRLTESEVLKMADSFAAKRPSRDGQFDVASFRRKAEFDAQSKTWRVGYMLAREQRESPVALGSDHFAIIIDDRTGEMKYLGGR